MQRGMGVPSLPKFQSVMCVYINSTTHVASPSPPQCGPLVPFNSPSSSSQWQGGYHVSTYLGTYPDSGSHQSFSSKSPLPITPLIPRSPPPRRRRHSRRSSSGINLPFLSKFLDHGLSAPVSKVPSPQDKPTPQQNSTAHASGRGEKKGGNIQPTPRDSPRSQSSRCRWTGCAGRGGSSVSVSQQGT